MTKHAWNAVSLSGLTWDH